MIQTPSGQTPSGQTPPGQIPRGQTSSAETEAHASVSSDPGNVEMTLSLKDMCAKFDVTPRTLRYYEYIELLFPQKEGRTRRYGQREVARMKLILRGRRFGFSLEEIRQWLLIYQQKGTAAQMLEWVRLADRQLSALADQKAALEAAIADLQALRMQATGDLPR